MTKFLTISIWCESFSDGFYVLPPVDEKFFYNELIFKAILILKIHDLAYKKSRINQNMLIDVISHFEKIKEENKEIKEENIDLKKKNKILEEEIEQLKKYNQTHLKQNSSDIDIKDEEDLPKKYPKQKRKRSRSKKNKSKNKKKN